MKFIPLSEIRLPKHLGKLGAIVIFLAAPALMAQTQVGAVATHKIKVKGKLQVSKSAGRLPNMQELPVAEIALTPAELSIAQWVEIGPVQCELGQRIEVLADAKMPGYFEVSGKTFRFHMVPVVSSTGAIRLEDVKAGAVWLQLANKSMLMSQKLGARLADACITPSQAAVAAAMEKSPPPGLLDAPVLTTQAPMKQKVALSDTLAR